MNDTAATVTMTRDERQAEANRAKASLKRRQDREKGVQSEVRGSGDLRLWLGGAKMKPQFVPATKTLATATGSTGTAEQQRPVHRP